MFNGMITYANAIYGISSQPSLSQPSKFLLQTLAHGTSPCTRAVSFSNTEQTRTNI